MRTLLASFFKIFILGILPISTVLAEDLAPAGTVESAAPAATSTPATTDTSPPPADDQGVESRGLLPPAPKIRNLTPAEITLAASVFKNTINYGMVRITDTLGAGGRPWTTNTPPMYMINVGSAYSSLTTSDKRKRLLIHELTHVWQGQHLVPFMLNSAAHQSLSAINNGGDVASAYSYTVGKPWGQYNVEQQASIVQHWFMPTNQCFTNGPCGGGMKTTDSRYRYIRDNIRANKAF
jgi:hypothetical protein